MQNALQWYIQENNFSSDWMHSEMFTFLTVIQSKGYHYVKLLSHNFEVSWKFPSKAFPIKKNPQVFQNQNISCENSDDSDVKTTLAFVSQMVSTMPPLALATRTLKDLTN